MSASRRLGVSLWVQYIQTNLTNYVYENNYTPCFKIFYPFLVFNITYCILNRFCKYLAKMLSKELKRHCNIIMLTYYMLSLAAGNQLKCCYIRWRQQISPAYRAHESWYRAFLARETPQFSSLIPNCGPHTVWICLVDYRVAMQERMYRTPIGNMNDLKQRLIVTWSGCSREE